MKKHLIWSLWAWVGLLGMVPAPAAAATPASPQLAQQQTQALVAAYRSCCGAQAGAPCAAVDTFFDYDTLSKQPIAPQLKKLSQAQTRRFMAAFASIIRNTARSSGQSFCGDNVPKVAAARNSSRGTEVDVSVHDASEDVDNTMTFVWRSSKGKLAIVDLLLEGASLSQDYQNQFARIVGKDGAEALVRKVESRVSKATKSAP